MTKIYETSRKFGLMDIAEKTKTMVTGKTRHTHLNIRGEVIKQVKQFVYLGELINAHGSNEKGIQRRIRHTSQAFGMMTRIRRSIELIKKKR